MRRPASAVCTLAIWVVKRGQTVGQRVKMKFATQTRPSRSLLPKSLPEASVKWNAARGP